MLMFVYKLAGYSGEQCDEQIDYCESGPCVNGALCNPFIGSYNCTCQVGDQQYQPI